MAEEVRFFLRTALYTALVSVVYWAMTYEEAGTVLFAGVIVSSLIFIAVISGRVPSARGGRKSVRTVVGFDEDPVAEDPLVIDEEVFPGATALPFLAALSSALILTGLVYGPWLWIPGATLGAATAGRWLSEAA